MYCKDGIVWKYGAMDFGTVYFNDRTAGRRTAVYSSDTAVQQGLERMQ